MILGNIYFEIAAILVLAATAGALGLRLRQPLIVTFIGVGILVGPTGFGLVTGHEEIELLAEIGIGLLLFIVGLKLDLKLIRTMGPVALATGLGQVLFTSIFGCLIALALGLGVVEAVYVAVALTFSSTIIIVKLLSDKKEIDALHGRIAVGFLIVQDIVVVVAMIALSALGAGDSVQRSLPLEIIWVVGKKITLIGGLLLLMKYVLPRLLRQLARSQEMLVLFAVSWSVFMAAVGDLMGFSKEVGAFLAGMSLASTDYREAIGSRLVTLRDFLLLFFFIDLGARMDLAGLWIHFDKAMIFSGFVLLGNPLIVMIIMGFMGYRKRTGFLAGLTVAQISEFSLILGALGLALGHITRDILGMITLVGLVTIGLSTYMILYSASLYRMLAPVLSIFERKNPFREKEAGSSDSEQGVDVVLFGLGTYGGGIARNLIQRKMRLVGMDFDPEAVRFWRARGIPAMYGDAGDPEILHHVPMDRAKWVISTLPDRDTNVTLASLLRHGGYTGKIVLTARKRDEVDVLREAGADLVFAPFEDAAEQAVDSLSAAMRVLPEKVRWPMALREVRLGSGSVFSGHSLAQIPLRTELGVSVLAVSRAGRTSYDPGPEFKLYPGDRVTLIGEPDQLDEACQYLSRREIGEVDEWGKLFSVAELTIGEGSPWIGQTLAGLDFRQKYGVTVIGIERKGQRILAPSGKEALENGDLLVLAGNDESIQAVVRSRGYERNPPEHGTDWMSS